MQSDKRTKPNLVSLAIQETADIMDFVVNLNGIRNLDISGAKTFSVSRASSVSMVTRGFGVAVGGTSEFAFSIRMA